jgi:hypothetical protein
LNQPAGKVVWETIQADFSGEPGGGALPLRAVLHEGHDFLHYRVGRFGKGLAESLRGSFESIRRSGGPDEGVRQAGQGAEICRRLVLDGGFEGAKEVSEEVGQKVAGSSLELGLGFAGGIGKGEKPGEEGTSGDFGRDVTGFGHAEDDGAGEG